MFGDQIEYLGIFASNLPPKTPRPSWASLQAYLEDEDARSLNPMQMLSEDGNWATKKSS